MSQRYRLVPIIVAFPLFLQNLDTSVMGTALPSIARSLDVEPLRLNLAITSYLLSLAVFLPLSGWFAERFGARRVFCFAIAFFSFGSALCGAATSLGSLVVYRVIQGLGGAMMVPVGRLLLLRSIPPAFMVGAMVWFTVPPAIGRMMGPLFGGVIVTLASWRWIFLVNVPFGLLGIALAWFFIQDSPADDRRRPFDLPGFVLMAIGLVCALSALETAGKSVIAPWISWALGAGGVALLTWYGFRSRRREHPLIDLDVLAYPTFRNSVFGGTPLRIAIGASPFLLPLMLQLGFGLSALESGLLTVATAVGSLATRTVMTTAIRRVGFRSLLIATAGVTSLFYMSYGLFRPSTPHWLMFATMMVGGLFNSMAMVSMQTLGFSEISKPLMSHATTLNSMAQQLSLSFGVMLGAALVSLAAWWRGGDASQLAASDFSPAFVFIGLMTLISMFSFMRLDPEEGAEMRS